MATASCSSFVGTASAFTNYARLGLATQNELPNILRELLFIKEPPHLLEAHLNNNSYLSKNLKAHEWNIIRTVRANKYNGFDVPLMYKIIRNLNLVPRPTHGWDNQTPPLATEIIVGDDIERIRRLRNEIVHRGNTNVQDPELSNYFSIFKELASRFEMTIMLSNGEIVSKIEHVETCCIDKDTEQHYLARLRELAKNEEELAVIVAEVNKDLACLRFTMTGHVSKLQTKIHSVTREQEEVIPKNIRDQIEKDLDKWKEDNKKYVPTHASDYVFSRLRHEKCVTVVGSPGAGKTAVTRHVALKMEEMGYTIIPITIPTDIRNFYQPGHPTVFVIDDICGNFTANKQLIDNWKQLLGVVENILSDNCKIIGSCRSQVYQDNKFSVLTPFKSCECNLISKSLQLTQSERKKIAFAHLGTKGTEVAQMDHCDFFPLLCFLCSRQDKINIYEFFSKPFKVFEKEFDYLWNNGKDGKYKICALTFCVIYNNKLKEKYLTGNDPSKRQIIDNVCDACGLNRGTSKVKIQDELDTLVGTYLEREKGKYKIVHDKLFDLLAQFCSKKMLDCLIENADSEFIEERFLWNKLHDENEEDNDFIVIPDDHLTLYLNRLILDWSNGKLIKVFIDNDNMENEKFRDKMLTQLLYRDKADQLKLVYIQEIVDGFPCSCLEACCSQGFTNFLPWILNQGVDINQCISGFTPLFVACVRNQTEIITELINSGADINKSGSMGMTPLHAVCLIDSSLAILNILIKHKACINKQTNYNGLTPLNVALTEDKIDKVNTLLHNGADCNIGIYHCQKIKDEIKKIMKHDIDIEQEEFDWLEWFTVYCPPFVVEYVKQEPNNVLYIIGGSTPLHLICFKNDIDMIRQLLDNNSDINIRKEDGSTPLFIACQFGFIDAATILLEHGADRNIYNNDEKKPLDIAKQNNHSEIISLLSE